MNTNITKDTLSIWLTIKRLYYTANSPLRRILDIIKDNPGITNSEIIMKMKVLSQPIISQHISELKKMNLIHQIREGKYQKHYPLIGNITDFNEKVEKIINDINDLV